MKIGNQQKLIKQQYSVTQAYDIRVYTQYSSSTGYVNTCRTLMSS